MTTGKKKGHTKHQLDAASKGCGRPGHYAAEPETSPKLGAALQALMKPPPVKVELVDPNDPTSWKAQPVPQPPPKEPLPEYSVSAMLLIRAMEALRQSRGVLELTATPLLGHRCPPIDDTPMGRAMADNRASEAEIQKALTDGLRGPKPT